MSSLKNHRTGVIHTFRFSPIFLFQNSESLVNAAKALDKSQAAFVAGETTLCSAHGMIAYHWQRLILSAAASPKIAPEDEDEVFVSVPETNQAFIDAYKAAYLRDDRDAPKDQGQ